MIASEIRREPQTSTIESSFHATYLYRIYSSPRLRTPATSRLDEAYSLAKVLLCFCTVSGQHLRLHWRRQSKRRTGGGGGQATRVNQQRQPPAEIRATEMSSLSNRGEKLSVTTAIIGLLAVGGKTIDSLWDLTTPATKSNTIFALALQELKQCRSTVHILYKTLSLLESAQLPFPERGTWIEVDYLIVTLTDTVLAVSELQALCESLILEEQGLLSPSPTKICDSHYSSYERIINGLCSRIRWHSLSMAMMTTILKWYVISLFNVFPLRCSRTVP